MEISNNNSASSDKNYDSVVTVNGMFKEVIVYILPVRTDKLKHILTVQNGNAQSTMLIHKNSWNFNSNLQLNNCK